MRYFITTLVLLAANFFWQGIADGDWRFALMVTYFQAVAAFIFWLQDKSLCKPIRKYKLSQLGK